MFGSSNFKFHICIVKTKQDDMQVNTSNLLKVSTYAKQEGVSLTTVTNWGKQGKIKTVIIDGVKFVIVK